MKKLIKGRPRSTKQEAIREALTAYSVTESDQMALCHMLPLEEVVDVITTIGPWDVGITDRGRYLVSRFLFETIQVCWASEVCIFFTFEDAMRFLGYKKAAKRLM